MTDTFNSCWVGDRLLPIANACINSFGAHGFAFSLFTYGPVADVPSFVERRDAESLVPANEIFVAHGGLETFCDRFAYRFLERYGGWWVDNDVLCNTRLAPDEDIAFAEERPGIINNAVLKFPAAHPVIIDLLAYIDTVDPVTAPWGSTGPLALTRIFKEQALERYQQPTSAFYPLHWRDAPKLLFPEFTAALAEQVAAAPFVHLWGATLREVGFDFRRSWPLDGSYLDLMYRRHLDAEIAAELRPLDEGAFRRSVQQYVEAHWNVALPLA
jgi:hypothetical protein